MVKNILIKPINVKLETSEEHLHSFPIIPYHQSLFGYTPSLEYYTIHLTNSRVIIEPAINKNIVNNIKDLMVGTATLLSHHAHHMQHKWNHAKEKMAMLKYTSISIPYKDIQVFENVKGSFNINLV